MERLISLFREPDYESWSPSDPQPPPREAEEEPLYFRQILEHLRQSRQEAAGPRGPRAASGGRAS